MNTTKKGDVLEKNALGIIEKLIDDKRLGVLKECIKIFNKKDKKYPSKLKGRGDVEFDLTVEVWAPDAPKYSMIYIFECKNYSHRVPIIQVKKFHSDILETHGVNAKGILISNFPLQKGAFEYADANDIMVIEGESKDNFEITLYKREEKQKTFIPIIKETKNSVLLDQGIISLGKIIDEQILISITNSNKQTSIGLEHLSKINIHEIAEIELNKIDDGILKNASSLTKNKLIDFLKFNYGISVVYFNPDNKNYLGTCEIDKLEIGISKKIMNTQREMFVIAHEFGHFILHQKIIINQILLDSFNDSEFNYSTGKHDLENPRQWIEWQANYFSASFLLPQSSITVKLWQSMQRRGLTKGDFILNDSLDSHRKFQNIVTYLSEYFNVSKTSIIYRLKEYDLLKENSTTKSLGQIIKEFKIKQFA